MSAAFSSGVLHFPLLLELLWCSLTFVCPSGVSVTLFEVSGEHTQARDVGRLVRTRCQRPGVCVWAGAGVKIVLALRGLIGSVGRMTWVNLVCGVLKAVRF